MSITLDGSFHCIKACLPSMLAKRDGNIVSPVDDLDAVNRLFQLIFDFVEDMKGQFQIIVLEHANLDDRRYQSSLVEQPWDGEARALVPPSWG